MDDSIIKGLKNEGNNICFLNVICQALWNLHHVKSFLFSNLVHSHSLDISESTAEKVQTKITQLKEEYKDEELPKETKQDGVSTYQENCLQCVLAKFFSDYMTSKLKSLDATEIRSILVYLNNTIQKFSKKGVMIN